jgi:UDP-N-acetylglucosamine:LPS N-acetylglucosamine transferase
MVASSAGGHWVQMRRILPAFEGLDLFFVGVEPGPDPALGPMLGPAFGPVRYYPVGNFTRKNPQAILGVIRTLRGIVRAERPDLAVTTGAGPGLMALAVAKLVGGSRTIWIDSIANTERLSLSGRLARPVADARLTQWEHLARPGGPEFWGAVI